MIEEYFNKYEKEIMPRNFNYPAFLIHYGDLNSQIENLQKVKKKLIIKYYLKQYQIQILIIKIKIIQIN